MASLGVPAISDHCFESPLSQEDVFHNIRCVEGRVNLALLKEQTDEKAAEAAKLAYRTAAKVRYVTADQVVGPTREIRRRSSILEEIYALMVSSRYRRGSVGFVHKGRRHILQKIKAAMQAGRPIELLLEFFSFKMRNALRTFATAGSEVDLSEVATILRFHEIAQAIGQIYPSGAVVKVAFDGIKFCAALETPSAVALQYYENLKKIVEVLGVEDTVEVFNQADHFPARTYINRLITEDHIRSAKQNGELEPELARTMDKLRNSMNFMLPIDPEIPIEQVARAFASELSDEVLRAFDPDAYHLRRNLQERADQATIRYVAAKMVVPPIDAMAPNAIRCSGHPKPGHLGLWIARRGQTLFPHHGQGAPKDPDAPVSVSNFRLRYAADIRRDPALTNGLRGIILPPDEFPFSDGKHPFTFAKGA